MNFGKKIEKEFNKQAGQELMEAKKYLEENPPKRKIVKDCTLPWVDLHYQDCNDKQILRLICAIKQVRNNLFHGDKNISTPKDPTRDSELIKHTITVLKYLLYSSPEVKNCYFEPLE
jgi:hypothetical protein